MAALVMLNLPSMVRSSYQKGPLGMHMQTPKLLSGLGVATALAAFVGAFCCVLPLLLAWAGLAGAWLISLEPFVVHRRTLAIVAVAVIAAGWWMAWPRKSPGGTLVVLSCATALTLGAVLVTEYEGPLQRYVVSLKRR